MQALSTKIKHITLFKRCLLLAALAFIFPALLIINSGCGKRKPPLPPIERVVQRVEISGKQFGNQIIISWVMPVRNASDTNVLNIDRADVYRLIEKDNSPKTLSEEEFANNSTLISTIPIKDSDFGKKILTYTDELKFAGQPVRLRYAIRFVNSAGQKATFSNFLIIEPTAKTAEAPNTLTSTITEQAINLKWIEPQKNVDGTTPVNILGYNIYRFSDKLENAKPLNQTPVTEATFADKTFEFNKQYSYFVRTVSLGKNSELVESLASNTVEVSPKDIFAPNPPTAITIAAAPNVLSIFFAVNLEKDIDGYRIYRSNDENLPRENWTLLTTELLKTNTFQDKTVESGKTYFYYLVAVDKAGNVSRISEIVSETAP